MNLKPQTLPVDHSAADHYEASRTLASRFIKEYRLLDTAWQWNIWFLFNGNQCGTRCPYWPDICFVGSDTCCQCPAFEGIQIVTAHSGRVYCKNRRSEVPLWPHEAYFLPEGHDRSSSPPPLPLELCPW